MAATSTSDASTEGPVVSLINKRLRALRKKQNRILQMEESLAQGKSLNKEQQEVLRSKPGLVALIEELEKLRAPLSSAVAEEISLAALRNPAGPPEERQDEPASAAAEQQQQQDTSESASAEEEHPAVTGGGEEATEKVLEDLLNLLYFGSLFDVMPQSEFTQTMLTRTHERNCCLTYDTVTDDAVDLLQEKDLDLIAALKGLLISRPVYSSLSHKNALQRCVQHAKLWLAKSDQGIDDQGSNVTYAGLREKLSKIISSDYYTTSPEMKRPVEMESFKTIQVPLHGSVMAISHPAQMEGSFQQEGKTTSVEEYETNGSHQSASVEEDYKGGPVNDNTEVSIQIEQSKSQQVEELNSRDMDMEDQQQYNPRRSYQNHRGGTGGRGSNGGRRGNPINRGSRGGGSRGGGGYQNGRSQYHDQGGNYYPRNHFRGRGGRGNDYYNNTHSSQMRGMEQHGHAESGVGVASS